MSKSDYTGEVVDVEVARYGLRTFRYVKSSLVDNSPRDVYLTGFPCNLVWNFTEMTVELVPPKPDNGAMELASTYIGGSHWKNGVCEATCRTVKKPEDRLRDRLIELAALSVGEQPVLVHQAPQEHCGCGIYATHTLEHLRCQYAAESQDIVAVVAAEGQTIIGTKGFRTQRARVVAYWCSDKVVATAERQFADAQRFPDVQPMLTEYGLEMGEPPQGSPLFSGWSYGIQLSSGPEPKIKSRSLRAKASWPNFASAALNGALFAWSHNWICLAIAALSVLLGVWFLVGKP